MKAKAGLALPVVITVIMLMFLVFFGIWQMMRGAGTQLEYSDAHVRALTIAEAAYNIILARLMSKPWESRWFADSPDSKSDIGQDGGSWDYYIENTPSGDMSADIWIRARYKNAKRLHFYRIRYEDLMFKNLTNPSPGFIGSMDDTAPQAFTPAAVNPLSEEMNRRISKRDGNRVKMTQKWDELSGKVNPLEILKSLGALIGEEEILDKCKPSKEGEPTDVPIASKVKKPAMAKPYIEKVEKTETLIAWFRDSVLLPTDLLESKIRDLVRKIQETIEILFKEEKFRGAERIYKEFLDYVFSVRVGVRTDELILKLEYYQKLAELAKSEKGKEFDRQERQLKKEYDKLIKALPPVVVASPTVTF